MNCPRCTAENPPGTLVCHNCGEAIESSPGPDPIHLPDDQLEEVLTVRPRVAGVTYALIAINVVVFLIMVFRGVSPTNPSGEALIRWGADYGPLTTHGQWWRLLTATFLHVGVVHLLLNMYVLFVIGTFTERLFGPIGFLVAYLLAGLAGSLASQMWHPTNVGAGASGAIFGLYGALIGFLLIHRNRIPRERLLSLTANAAIFLLFNLGYGLTKDHVDVAAHLGGLVGGIVVGGALAVPTASGIGGRGLGRSAAVFAAGLVLVTIGARRIPVTDDWGAELARFVAVERTSTATYNKAVEALRANKMRRDEFADVLDKQLAPDWQSERQRLAGLKVPNDQKSQVRKALAFVDLKLEGWRLTADGLRTNDQALLHQGNVKQDAALAALAEFSPNPAILAQLAAVKKQREAEDALAAELVRVRDVERGCLSIYNDILKKGRARQVSPEKFAETIEKRVLPPWNEEKARLDALKLGEPQDTEARRFAQYMELRSEGWTLIAQGARTNDNGLMTQGFQKHAAAAKMFSVSTPPTPEEAQKPRPSPDAATADRREPR